MKIKAHHLSALRLWLLGLTGATSLGYAGLALAQNQPNPVYWWVPIAVGLITAIVLFLVFLAASSASAKAATDELYRMLNQRAAAEAYWISLVLLILTSVAIGHGLWAPNTLLAATAAAMGGTYLIRFVWLDLRA